MTERETTPGLPLEIVEADWLPEDAVLIVSGTIPVERVEVTEDTR